MLAQRAFSVGRFAAKLVWSVPISLSNPQEDVDIEDFKSSFPNETSTRSSTKRKRIVYKTKRSNINISSDFGFGEVPLKSLACNWFLSSFSIARGLNLRVRPGNEFPYHRGSVYLFFFLKAMPFGCVCLFLDNQLSPYIRL